MNRACPSAPDREIRGAPADARARGEEGGGAGDRGDAAPAVPGETLVGVAEESSWAVPHAGQNRLPAGTSAWQEWQVFMAAPKAERVCRAPNPVKRRRAAAAGSLFVFLKDLVDDPPLTVDLQKRQIVDVPDARPDHFGLGKKVDSRLNAWWTSPTPAYRCSE